MEPGGFDFQQILQAAQQVQAQLANAQQTLADSEVTGTAGGGAVQAVVNGQGELVDLTIAPSVVDPADPAETVATIADRLRLFERETLVAEHPVVIRELAHVRHAVGSNEAAVHDSNENDEGDDPGDEWSQHRSFLRLGRPGLRRGPRYRPHADLQRIRPHPLCDVF